MPPARPSRVYLLLLAMFAIPGSATFAQLAPPVDSPGPSRFGPFGLFDDRSTYGQFWFVEPLRAPEMDVDRELRIDYTHSESAGIQGNEIHPELEYNFNFLTIELETSYQWGSESTFDHTARQTTRERSQGFGGIEVSARHPIFEYVSPTGALDYTLVGAFELALPSNSPVSKDTEFVPQLFQLLRVGEHLSVEASVGYSSLVGPSEGGTNTLEYNVVLGYNLEHEQLPLPGILRTIPIFELNGERALSGPDSGINRLSATVGFRVNLRPIGAAQPRLGFGYFFPIDQGARDERRWGMVTSLVFEF